MNMKAAIFGIGILALAGCETATTSSGGTAAAQVDSFIADTATAELIASECPSLSMRSSTEALTSGFIQQMLDRGASPIDISRAVDQVDDYEMAADIVGTLMRAGVDPNNPATICSYGRQQIASGTRVGSFLR